MAIFIYTAKRSLLGSHVAGEAYTIEIGTTDFNRSRRVQKSVKRSLGGAMEVLRDYADAEWTITFEPVGGARLDELREFLDSTDGGELFSMDLHGNSASLVTVKRTDEGYTETPFMRTGDSPNDLYQVGITAIEA